MDTVEKTYNNSISRKVFLYEIQCKKKGAEADENFIYTAELFQKMKTMFGVLEYNNTKDNRWYGIEEIQIFDNSIEVVFISCKYKYKPNLINIQNRTERPSPKIDEEGDKEKTHVLIKGNRMAYEQRRNGTSVSVCSRFLNMVWKEIKGQLNNDVTSIVLRQELVHACRRS